MSAAQGGEAKAKTLPQSSQLHFTVTAADTTTGAAITVTTTDVTIACGEVLAAPYSRRRRQAGRLHQWQQQSRLHREEKTVRGSYNKEKN